jgi:hypothetical protein
MVMEKIAMAEESFLTRWARVIQSMPRQVREPQRWRHKKRGSCYTLVGKAQVQAPEDGPLTDYEIVQVYVGDDGEMWVRRLSEFFDGRFEPIERSTAS